METKPLPQEKTFLSFLDDDGQQRNGYVYVLEINQAFVKFSTKDKILIIPWSRILKIKEESSNG